MPRITPGSLHVRLHLDEIILKYRQRVQGFKKKKKPEENAFLKKIPAYTRTRPEFKLLRNAPSCGRYRRGSSFTFSCVAHRSSTQPALSSVSCMHRKRTTHLFVYMKVIRPPHRRTFYCHYMPPGVHAAQHRIILLIHLARRFAGLSLQHVPALLFFFFFALLQRHNVCAARLCPRAPLRVYNL